MSEKSSNTMDIKEIIILALWNKSNGSTKANHNTFEELQRHTIEILPASVLSQIEMPSDVRWIWKTQIFRQLLFYNNYCHAQKNLQLTIPYVILKGTEAAKYYPEPQYRTMGDIDIMTSREEFDKAQQELLDNGYKITKELDREITFEKNGIFIELHRYFASLNDPGKAQYLDNLIIESINPSHSLPDTVNGLVLLEHISQHLEHGLGLRQIIDWMMFVYKCLSDEKWPEFRALAQNIGMETLAVVTTRMCEMYLGLPEHAWCAKADEKLCGQMMEYVLACGNFGNKKNSDSDIAENVFSYARGPKAAIKLLQQRGMANWKAARKYRFLRPFAWVYQANRYLFKGLCQRNSMIKINTEYKNARQRIAMFEALGVKQTSKGIAVYSDGRFVKH